MHRRIDTALRQLRQDLAPHLDEPAVQDAGTQVGHVWRACLLTPFAILPGFLLQVLPGNTALTHVSLLAGRSFTPPVSGEKSKDPVIRNLGSVVPLPQANSEKNIPLAAWVR